MVWFNAYKCNVQCIQINVANCLRHRKWLNINLFYQYDLLPCFVQLNEKLQFVQLYITSTNVCVNTVLVHVVMLLSHVLLSLLLQHMSNCKYQCANKDITLQMVAESPQVQLVPFLTRLINIKNMDWEIPDRITYSASHFYRLKESVWVCQKRKPGNNHVILKNDACASKTNLLIRVLQVINRKSIILIMV